MKLSRILGALAALAFFAVIVAWPHRQAPSSGKVLLRPAQNTAAEYDVFVLPENAKEELFLMKLDNVYANHYHAAEYRDGILYVIRRFQESDDVTSSPSDELWSFKPGKEGKRLFKAAGLDFRGSNSEKTIAVLDVDGLLTILDGEGRIEHQIQRKEYAVPDNEEQSISLVEWQNDNVILNGRIGRMVANIYKVSSRTLEHEAYDVFDKGFIQYSFSAIGNRVAYTDELPALEAGTEDIAKAVGISVYDTKKNTIAKIISLPDAKDVRVTWADPSTLIITDATGRELREIVP